MRTRKLILALALLLAVAVSGFAQYGDGGTQTFTVPRLTVLGPLTVNGTTTLAGTPTYVSSIVFEGATANDFETTLTVTDPTTPDKTITFPDATGTVALLGSVNMNRSDLIEQALQPYGVSVFDLRQTTGIPLVVAETAGNFNMSVAANVILATGEITDNETEVSVTQFQFTLPVEYVTAGDVEIRITCVLTKTAAAVDNGSTIDVSAYWQFGETVGADLVTTAAQTFAATDQSYTKSFALDEATLTPGATLNVVVTSSVVDSEAGGGTLQFKMEAPKIHVDIKG